MAEVVSVVDAEAASVEAVASAVEADASNFETSFFISFITEGGLTVNARLPSFVFDCFLHRLQVFTSHTRICFFSTSCRDNLRKCIDETAQTFHPRAAYQWKDAQCH